MTRDADLAELSYNKVGREYPQSIIKRVGNNTF